VVSVSAGGEIDNSTKSLGCHCKTSRHAHAQYDTNNAQLQTQSSIRNAQARIPQTLAILAQITSMKIDVFHAHAHSVALEGI